MKRKEKKRKGKVRWRIKKEEIRQENVDNGTQDKRNQKNNRETRKNKGTITVETEWRNKRDCQRLGQKECPLKER